MVGGDLVFALSALADVGLAVGVLLVLRRFGALWALGAFVLAAVIWAAKLELLALAGLDAFGVVHVLWLDLVVAIPVAGLLLLFGRDRHPLTRVVGGLALVPGALGIYASFIEPGRLVVERSKVTVPAVRTGTRPVRLGVVSDLQFSKVGEHERRAVDRMDAQHPDVILLPGDLHQGSPEGFREELPKIRRLLGRLRAPGGVFFVPGDQERGGEADDALAGTGIRLLSDETVRLRVGDRRIALTGLQLRPGAEGGRAALRRTPGLPGDIRLVLAHRPDWITYVRPGRADLVVSGHTHGGQVQVPYAGPPTVASRVPRGVGAGGLHVIDGTPLYVSRGVGVERGQAPKLRIGSPPEVSVITLRG
jgi:predicted MPP superfamily phosphohydrolase